MPANELDCAEATLAVLDRVLAGLAPEDSLKQTPCREYDVASLTDHLMNSITDSAVRHQVMSAARPALNAWTARGLDGTVPFGEGEAPAQMMAGILCLEFLVHAWDYAAATGLEVDAPEELSEYVLGLSQGIITPEGRGSAGFDDPIDLPDGAAAFDRLLAFTGRRS